MTDDLVEHATQMSGGGMHVRAEAPGLERVFPLAQWIAAKQGDGGKVYRRVVRVVKDWVEVPKS